MAERLDLLTPEGKICDRETFEELMDKADAFVQELLSGKGGKTGPLLSAMSDRFRDASIEAFIARNGGIFPSLAVYAATILTVAQKEGWTLGFAEDPNSSDESNTDGDSGKSSRPKILPA